MKRTAIFLLIFCLLHCAACASPASKSTTNETVTPQTLPPTTPYDDPTGYKVTNPMEYPDYTLDKNVDTLTLRTTAVKAFEDLLSIRWSTPIPIKYNKTGPVSNKTFQHEVDVTYAGTIYSNANTGLFQFLEFYNFETGRLVYPGEVKEMKETIGASCADAMIWGVTAVCNSLTGPYYPVTMVHKNGYLPVGTYSYDFSISSFNQLPTYKIVEQNGKDVIIDAYTLVQPGDMFVSTPDNHGMMAKSYPSVYYTNDGTVDLDKSYVIILDQRGGQGSGFYESKEGGEIIRYSGRTSAKFTFRQLLDKSYLPVTTAEFAGAKPYERAEVTVSGTPCKSLEDLKKATVECNYPLAVINVIVADQFGNEIVIDRTIFGGGGDNGVPRTYPLGVFACWEDFKNSPYNAPSYIIKIEVVPSTGERFIVLELPL